MLLFLIQSQEILLIPKGPIDFSVSKYSEWPKLNSKDSKLLLRRIYKIATLPFFTIIFANKFFTLCEITFPIHSRSEDNRLVIIICNDYI